LIRIQSNNRLWSSLDINVGSIRIDSYERQIMLDSDGEDYELYWPVRIDTGGCAVVPLKRCSSLSRPVQVQAATTTGASFSFQIHPQIHFSSHQNTGTYIEY
jgi:hypothetical protein